MVAELAISRLEDVRDIQAVIRAALVANGFSDRALLSVELTLEEAPVHAIEYDNQFDPTKRVSVQHEVAAGRLDVRVNGVRLSFPAGRHGFTDGH